jgi:hypothetical protein
MMNNGAQERLAACSVSAENMKTKLGLLSGDVRNTAGLPQM